MYRTPHRIVGRPRRLAAAAVLAGALAAVSACSGGMDTPDAAPSSSEESTSSSSAAPSSSTGSESAVQTITATEDDFSIALEESELTAGSYEIEVVNDGSATHDLVVELDGEDIAASDTIGPGESTTVTVDLEPGEYVFYCSIGAHRSMGMELTVQVT
ncbi:plastocyanin/azurin family copper-binding protein [Blastococcus sp. LR1]|uniref:cupredoxin domain-containing protein n=1 Tax=Blastococcus sp. LR1 TaxID=2877000 RepID=UPI001CCE3F3B|nr:plastocyanin/azurin family copper-binding protein [Blastococcus sp. LR1]MCA0146700.1 cupredoxin domain-containing protein [Blastococcus sp. LR1]